MLWWGVRLFTLERPLPSDQDKAGGREAENAENQSEEGDDFPHGSLGGGDSGEAESQASDGYSPSLGGDVGESACEDEKM